MTAAQGIQVGKNWALTARVTVLTLVRGREDGQGGPEWDHEVGFSGQGIGRDGVWVGLGRDRIYEEWTSKCGRCSVKG